MIFYLIGIDHKTVGQSVRESAYRLRNDIVRYWQHAQLSRAAVLTTCNRIEIYGLASRLDEAKTIIDTFRYNFNNQFKDAYVFYGEENLLKHGLRLACGLESQLQGESQIIEQLESWLEREDFPYSLREIWTQIIAKARQIRLKAGLSENAVNIARLVFEDLKKENSFTENKQIIIIGTGRIAKLIAAEKPESANLIFIARRNHAKAQLLANLSRAEALLRSSLSEYLLITSAVVCATSSPHYVLREDDFKKTISQRKRPLYIYDLATPADVAPEVSAIPFVRLKDLNSLVGNYSKQNRSNLQRIELASQLIEEEIYEYRKVINV